MCYTLININTFFLFIMKLLFDFFPVLLFFIAFKIYGIYAATYVAIGASFLQVVIYYILHRKLEKMHVITFLLILVLGGATLLFRDPVFIKWKPTGIYWITALVFLGSQYYGNKNLVQKMMEANLQLPPQIWKLLNFAWCEFFVVMGCLNVYIAYNYDTNTWVNFKFFGGLGLTMIFVVLQSIFLAKHVIDFDNKSPTKENN